MTTADVSKILEHLREVSEQVARLEERLGGSKTHENRIQRLEQRWAAVAAIVAFLTLELQALGVVVALWKIL